MDTATQNIKYCYFASTDMVHNIKMTFCTRTHTFIMIIDWGHIYVQLLKTSDQDIFYMPKL